MVRKSKRGERLGINIADLNGRINIYCLFPLDLQLGESPSLLGKNKKLIRIQ